MKLAVVEEAAAIVRRAGRIRAVPAWWPYAAFGLAAILYNVLTLLDGFNYGGDEGYLQSVAQRLLFGEHLYRDFDYWRTPLSVYLQAGFLGLLGHYYTILTARWVCAVQIILITGLLSLTYRRAVKPVELFLLLGASYTLTSMLLTFPWYNYDAVFFAAVALTLLYYRRYFWCGVAAALAGLAKQSFLLWLPLLFAVLLIVRATGRRWALLPTKAAAQTAAGLAVTIGAYVLYLAVSGDLTEFYRQILVLPKAANPVTWQFAFLQDNGAGWRYALPAAALLVAAFYLPVYRVAILGVGIVGFLAFRPDLLDNPLSFTYLAIVVNYVVGLVVLQQLAAERTLTRPETARYLLLFIGGLVTQYLAGFTFSGLWFASIGAGIALPLGYVLVREVAGSHLQRNTALAVLVAVGVLAASNKYQYVYHDAERANLTAEYPHGRLAGVRTNPTSASDVTQMLAAINKYSREGEYIFLYPDCAAFYYLTGRRNPTRIDWYYMLGQDGAVIQRALAPLAAHPPKLILLRTDKPPGILDDLVRTKYHLVQQTGMTRLFVPNG